MLFFMYEFVCNNKCVCVCVCLYVCEYTRLKNKITLNI